MSNHNSADLKSLGRKKPSPWKDGSLGVSVTCYPEEDILLGRLGLWLICFRCHLEWPLARFGVKFGG